MATIYDEQPTSVRYQIVAAMTIASVLLYFHRAFVAELFKYEQVLSDLHLTSRQVDLTFSAFFFSYALCQVPSGWVADAFGRRFALTAYIVAWSLFTALGGLATGFAMIFVVRLALGIAQAGAYPTSGGLVAKWVPLAHRALASAVVSAGGRAGGILAPIVTSALIAGLGMPWQTVMLLYGGIGIAVGMWFWIVAREEPAVHPWCNDAERSLIAEGRPPVEAAVPATRVKPPIYELLTSRTMWCMSVAQFGTNIGWAFVITKMPTYLKQVKDADDMAGGGMAGFVWAVGALGLLLGGRLCDWTTRRFGLRHGRMLTTIVTRFVAAALYAFVLQAEDAMQATVALAAVTFCCDLGLAAVWAFAQDVGGRSVGSVLGWGNMFGNLGAAAAPLVYGWADEYYGGTQMHGTLYAAMAGFIVSGIAAMGINPAKPIVPEDRETAAA